MNDFKKLNILFLSPRFAYPVIGGDRLKQFHIFSYLAKKHNVTLVTFYQGKNIPIEYIKEIEKTGVELHIIPLNQIKAGLSTIPRLLKYPLEIAYYTQKNFQKRVDELLKSKIFDVTFSFFMRAAEYVKNQNIKKILMSEDCRILYQYRSSKESNNLLQKIVRYWEYLMLKKYEPKIVNFFDIVTLVTEHDIEEMKKNNPKPNYKLLSNGVDINKFIPPDNQNDRKDILFAGKLDIWANVLMIQRIIKEILPLIRIKIPDVVFNIVGAYPPKEILSYASNNIKIHTNVPDMIPYLQNSALFLHPHSGGTGIQNKLLEAMSCGLPVVTTPTGIQGIHAENGKNVLVGKNNEELANHVISILENPQQANEISLNARKLIVEKHSWEYVFHSLDLILDELMNKNQTNFLHQ